MGLEIVKMPKVGEMMEEATVIEWIVELGQAVEAEHPLVVVNTDKVEYEVEAPRAGTISRLIAEEGQTIPVGEPLCEMEVPD